MTVQRRLAAILAADVVGFSSLMERDEEGTHRQIKVLEREVIGPLVEQHQGRIVKTAGDGILVEFASPIEAVRSAVAIQTELASGGSLELRMGINLGDVIVDPDGDVYGEGVNVAARLEALCDPGSILVSGKVFDEIEGKVETTFESRGEQRVKNIAKPLRVYEVACDRVMSVRGPNPLPLPDKPSIAVLPFANLSGDPSQDYFVDGVVEEIITALSRVKWLFVIARNSSFTYKGRHVDVKQVASNLGVRYVLEGSFRKVGNRIRITGELVEAATGANLWADRVECLLTDIFSAQDEITERVAGAIAPRLQQAEMERAKQKPTGRLDAYDVYLRGLAQLYAGPREDNDEALRLFIQATTLDPRFAAAYSMASYCYVRRRANVWLTTPAEELAEGLRLARRSVELGREDPTALCFGGYGVARLGGSLEEGAAHIRKGLTLNPNLAAAWNFIGLTSAFVGEAEQAIEEIKRGIRLSPVDPNLYSFQGGMGLAHFLAGRYAEAAHWSGAALREQPTFLPALRVLAASCAFIGRHSEAQEAARRILDLDPSFRVSLLRERTPVVWPEGLTRKAEGLIKAGLPE